MENHVALTAESGREDHSSTTARFAPEDIADHLAELDRRAVEFSYGNTGFDYLYGSSARIIRYLLSKQKGA
jgi:hypothetical protein